MMTNTKLLTEALRTVLNEAEALDREVAQLRGDVERLAEENCAACDTIYELREEVRRLRAELSGAETVPESEGRVCQ